MSLFNNWHDTPIIHQSNIINYSFLESHSLITHLDSEYYYLNNPDMNLELFYYQEKNKDLAHILSINDVDASIKVFIDDLNTYNEIKDIADALMGKISELRGVSLMTVREEFGLDVST